MVSRFFAFLFASTLVATALPASAGLFNDKNFTSKLSSADDAPKVDVGQLARYARKGFGSVRGHLGIADTTQSGNEITFSHSEVFLVPDVPYTHWYFMDYLTRNFKRLQGYAVAPNKERRVAFLRYDATAMKYTRKYRTDAQGRYEFLNLPSGKYYVVAVVDTEYSGTSVQRNIFGGANVSNYKAEYYVLLGDDPPLAVSGDRSSTASALKRIVPNQRGPAIGCALDRTASPCADVIDLDQFTGGRSDY